MTLLEVSNLNFYVCKERTVVLQRAVIRTKYVVYAICLEQCLERCKILTPRGEVLGRRREGQAPFRVGSRTGGTKEGAGRPRQLLGQRRDVGTAARGRHDLLGRAPRDVVVGLRACGRAGRRPRWGAGRPARHTPGATAADPTLPDGLAPPPGRCSPTEASDEQAGEARCAGGQSPQVKAGCLGSLCGGAQARPTPASLLRVSPCTGPG